MSAALNWEKANERDALRRVADRREEQRVKALEELASAILRDAGFDPESAKPVG